MVTGGPHYITTSDKVMFLEVLVCLLVYLPNNLKSCE